MRLLTKYSKQRTLLKENELTSTSKRKKNSFMQELNKKKCLSNQNTV